MRAAILVSQNSETAAILVFLAAAGWKALIAARRADKELVAGGMADVVRGLDWGWGRGLFLSHP